MTTSLFLDDICTLVGLRTDWKGSQSNSDDVDKKTLPKKSLQVRERGVEVKGVTFHR